MAFEGRVDTRSRALVRAGFQSTNMVDGPVSGAGFSILPETQALINAMSGGAPNLSRTILIDNTIRSLKSASIWTKLDVFYMFAAHNAQAGLLNWVSPSTLLLTNNNSTVFSTDRGYTGDGISMSLSTSTYTPSKWVQDSGSAGVVAFTNGSGANSLTVQNGTPVPRMTVRARNTTSSLVGVSASSNTTALTGAATPNMVAGDRSDAVNQSLYVNGVLDVTGVVASVAFGGTPGTIWILGNGTTFQSQQIGMAWIGASLGSDQLTMYNIVLNYMRTVGAM